MRGRMPRVIVVPEFAPVVTGPVITVTGSGNSTYCYVTINNSKITSAKTFNLSEGDTISCYIRGPGDDSYSTISVNGVVKVSKWGAGTGNNTYDHTVTTSATVTLEYKSGSSGYARISIVEEG